MTPTVLEIATMEVDGQAEVSSLYLRDSKLGSNSAGCTTPLNSSLFARQCNAVALSCHKALRLISKLVELKPQEDWKTGGASGLCVKVRVFTWNTGFSKEHVLEQSERAQCAAIQTSTASIHS